MAVHQRAIERQVGLGVALNLTPFRALASAMITTAIEDFATDRPCNSENCTTRYLEPSRNIHTCAADAERWLWSHYASELISHLDLDPEVVRESALKRRSEARALEPESEAFSDWLSTYFPEGG